MVSKEKGKKKAQKFSKIEKQVMWLLAVLAIVVLISVAAYYLMKPKSPYFEYGPFEVYKKRLEGTSVDYYYIPFKMIDGPLNQIAIRNDPRELGDISLNVSEELWRGISKVWVSSDPNLSYAPIPAGEIGRFTIAIGLDTSYAFSEDAGSYYQMSCENATENIRVVELRVGDETKVYSEVNCIIIEGKDDVELSRAADKLAVTWLERLVIGTEGTKK